MRYNEDIERGSPLHHSFALNPMADFKKGGSMLVTKLELKKEEATFKIGTASGPDEIMSLVEQTQEIQEELNASRAYEVSTVRGTVQLVERSVVNSQGSQMLACDDYDEMEIKLLAALEALRDARARSEQGDKADSARYVIPA